jgi:hypothetical protein
VSAGERSRAPSPPPMLAALAAALNVRPAAVLTGEQIAAAERTARIRHNASVIRNAPPEERADIRRTLQWYLTDRALNRAQDAFDAEAREYDLRDEALLASTVRRRRVHGGVRRRGLDAPTLRGALGHSVRGDALSGSAVNATLLAILAHLCSELQLRASTSTAEVHTAQCTTARGGHRRHRRARPHTSTQMSDSLAAVEACVRRVFTRAQPSCANSSLSPPPRVLETALLFGASHHPCSHQMIA